MNKQLSPYRSTISKIHPKNNLLKIIIWNKHINGDNAKCFNCHFNTITSDIYFCGSSASNITFDNLIPICSNCYKLIGICNLYLYCQSIFSPSFNYHNADGITSHMLSEMKLLLDYMEIAGKYDITVEIQLIVEHIWDEYMSKYIFNQHTVNDTLMKIAYIIKNRYIIVNDVEFYLFLKRHRYI